MSLAPSLAGSVLGALDFLTDYPYGCTEQTLSSFLPNLLVTRALTELKLAPTERLSALDRQVSAGLAAPLRLSARRWRLGMVEGRRQSSVHDRVRAVGPRRSAARRRQGRPTSGISNGARELAQLYAQYPRVEPDLKAYEAYVLQRTAADEPQIRVVSPNGSRAATATPPRATSCGACAAA